MGSGEQAIVNQLCKLVNEFTEVKKLLRASEDRIIDVFYVTVPEAGGTRNFSVGITKINFKTGAITNPDGTIDTLTRRLDLTQEKDFMHSISIHSNCDVKFRLDSAGQQTIDAQFLFQLPYVTYTTLEIECTIPTEISIFACTNPQATLGNFKVSDMTQQTILGDGVELDTYDSITSLLSNLNRIRYQIKVLSGEANWDDAPGTDLSSVAGDILTHAALSIDVHGVGAGNSVASDDDIATHEADTSVHGVAEVAGMADIVKGDFGDGSDGDVTISADTDLNGVAKQYNNLTINAGFKLYDSTGHLAVRVKNTLTLNGDIDQSGQGGSGGAGGATTGGVADGKVGVAGNAGLFGTAANGGAGGGTNLNGANGSEGSGGGGSGTICGYAAGTGGVSPTLAIPSNTDNMQYLLSFIGMTHPNTTIPSLIKCGNGGGGGGGGCGCATGGEYGGTGGNGGAGGGFLILFAKTIIGAGNIKSTGINGNDGETVTAGAAANRRSHGGGGGGGTGGFICVTSVDFGSASFASNAGTGGAGGTGYKNAGNGGTPSFTGIINKILIS